MAIEFKKETDAFLAVLSLVAGADDSGSLEERDFLFNKVKAIGIFGNPSKADFSHQLGAVNDVLYAGSPDVDAVLAAAKKSLSAASRSAVVQLAGELSAADGAEARETALVDKIRKALA